MALVDPATNPFYRHAQRELFLARRGGRVVGRVAAIHDRLHLETHGDGAGFFGFFECEDDRGRRAGAARRGRRLAARARPRACSEAR